MIKKLPKSKVEIALSVKWADWEKYLDVAAAEVSQEIKISGFRPGKAPRKMVEQKVGKELLLNNAAEKAVSKAYVDFVVKEKLEVLGRPEVKLDEIKEGADLKFTAIVAVMPEVTVDEKYKEKVKKINAEYAEKKIEIGEKEIESELKKLANSRVKLVTVRREAKKDDSVEIDFEVLVGGVPIENGSSKKHLLVLGRGVFIPGFEDNVIGMKEGDEKEFELSFPEDYHKKDLAGKKATFKVKLNLVQERQTPDINDDFAKSLGNFENLEALKKNIQEGMEHEEKHKREEEKRGKYMDEVVASTQAELPEILVEEEIGKMLQEFEYQIQSMGMNLDQYLGQIKKTKDELSKDWKPQAEKRVKSALGLKEIVKMEEVKVESKAIEAEMNKTMQYYKKVKDFEKNVDMERLYTYTKGMLENEEVFKMLEALK